MLTVYGHRGLPSKAPENTIASFKSCFRRYKLVELDVAITKDEQLIIIHDDYLERTYSFMIFISFNGNKSAINVIIQLR